MSMTPYEIFQKYPGHRDYIFRKVLSQYRPRPINVFQIGGIQNWLPTFRVNSGWSDGFWAEYINVHGGSLTICDIEPQALKNSGELFTEIALAPQLTVIESTGEKYLKQCLETGRTFDIYYLDGSDCPNEMVEQFFLVPKNKGITVMCDDWSIKGQLLAPICSSMSDCKIDYYDAANGVAVFSYS